MHNSADSGDPDNVQDVSNAALPRRKLGYVPGRGYETPEQKKKRIDAENAEWESRSGPVTVRYKKGYEPK